MNLKLSFICALVLGLCTISSCDSDPDNLYGKNKEMQILDESGKPCTNVNASFIYGTTLSIVGGLFDCEIPFSQQEQQPPW